jgi:hypothetical protein
MKNTVKLSMLAFAFALLHHGLLAQQTGLAWINLFGSEGIEYSPGFVAHPSGNYYLALTFGHAMTMPGTTDTLHPKGNVDGLVACMNPAGQLLSFWQLSNKGHISITDIALKGQNIVISGSFQDSLDLINANGTQTLLVTENKLNGFVLELSATGEPVRVENPMPNAPYAATNYLHKAGETLIAASFAKNDSLAPLTNNLHFYQTGSSSQLQLKAVAKHKVLGLTSYNDHAVVYGTFTDTLFFEADSLFAMAGTDAYFGLFDEAGNNNGLYGFGSYQNTEAISATSFAGMLWVALNFSDTLFLPNSDTVVSAGSNDFLLAAFDSTMQLAHRFQTGGVFAERSYKLFVQDNELFVFSNVASPQIGIYHNDTLQHQIFQENFHGNAALFSIDTAMQSSFLWMTQHDWSSRITGLHKIGQTETIISGMFTDRLRIDSLQFDAVGNTDAFLLRISDACISRLKSSYYTVQFCEGDSVFLHHIATNTDGKLYYDAGFEGGTYITGPTQLVLEQVLECGCRATDSLVFEQINAVDALKSIVTEGPVYLRLMNTQLSLKMDYCGDCAQSRFFRLQTSPNPFEHESKLLVTMADAGKLTYTIHSMDGVMLSQAVELSLGRGTHHIRLPLQHLPPGTYVVWASYQTAEKSGTRHIRLIKQ